MSDVTSIIGWILLLISIAAALKWRSHVWGKLMDCSPYVATALGCIAVHSTMGLYDPGMDGPGVASMIMHNSIQVLRSWFLASIGLIVYSQISYPRVSLIWQDLNQAIGRIPVYHLLGLSFLISAYTLSLFLAFGQQNPYHGQLSSSFIISEYALGATGSIVEELVIRGFVLPITALFLRSWKYRWWFALVLSSLLWTIEHSSSFDLLRFAQLFPTGILLGSVMLRYGLETVVLIHMLSNLLLLSTILLLRQQG